VLSRSRPEGGPTAARRRIRLSCAAGMFSENAVFGPGLLEEVLGGVCSYGCRLHRCICLGHVDPELVHRHVGRGCILDGPCDWRPRHWRPAGRWASPAATAAPTCRTTTPTARPPSNLEVLPGVPRPLRVHRRRPGVSAPSSSTIQPSPPSHGHRPAHPGIRATATARRDGPGVLAGSSIPAEEHVPGSLV
jgi:hypothetical protein